jgi:hypothetical protein
VSRRQAGRWAQHDQRRYEQPYESAAQSEAPAPSMENKLAQLKQLGELKTQGVLSDAEFEQQKSRILNT